MRAGETNGITYKHIGNSNAIEAILGVWSGGFGLTVLYERYTPAFDEPGFSWYYGGGGHIAFFDGYRRGWFDREHEYHDDVDMAFGVDGIVGLEYRIPPIPIAISLDLKPFLELDTDGNAGLWLDPGLGLKFVF